MVASLTPLLGFAAWSGTGKTTLLRKLIPMLQARGIRAAVIKHAHHDFDIDKPGKDSYELRKAGADQVLVASSRRWALVTEMRPEREPVLEELAGHLDKTACDLILVEGFRHLVFPKIELHRPSLGKPLLYPDDPSIIAVATDDARGIETQLPVLDLNDAEAIAAFIAGWCQSQP